MQAALRLQKFKELEKVNKFYLTFPANGPYSRDKYKKHIAVINATAKYNQVCMIGGNRTGKTELLAHMFSAHLTGDYPEYWEGKKFDCPINAAIYAVNNRQLREGVGKALIGGVDESVLGTGQIPKDRIIKVERIQGSGGFADYVTVRHSSGGVSKCMFYSADAGRKSLQGATFHLVGFDEEPPQDIYNEGIVRTATIGVKEDGSDAGLILLAFTPLNGLSEVALKFLPEGYVPTIFNGMTYVVNITWDDVPHITEFAKKSMMSEMAPWEIRARVYGLPVAGAGAVYPIAEKDVSCPRFRIPEDWPRVYGFDYSMRRSAALFCAIDPDRDIMYAYDLYVGKETDFLTSSHNIKRVAKDWMPGIAESKNANWETKQKWIDVFKNEYGLNLYPAPQKAGQKDLEISRCHSYMSSGKFKVFEDVRPFFAEMAVFHYEPDPGPDGKPVIHKHNDDIMDSFQYVCNHGWRIAKVDPAYDYDIDKVYVENSNNRNPITGY